VGGQDDFLQGIDTPPVCHLVEIIAPRGSARANTVKHLNTARFQICHRWSDMPKTVTFKARNKVAAREAGYMQKRLDYLDRPTGTPPTWP